jgi:hypothetical protein
MPQKTEYLADKGIIVITYTEKVTMDEVRQATVEAIAIQRQGLTDRVLIETSGMTAWPSLVDMWHLVKSYPELEVPPQTRLAAVRPRVPDETDISGFYEVVCQNRCYNAKAFQTREDAEEWLRSDKSANSLNA